MQVLLILFILLFLFCFIITAAVINALWYVKNGGEISLSYEDDDSDTKDDDC